MDKRTVLAFVLIGVILVLWPYYQRLITPPSLRQKTIEKSTAEEPSKNNIEKEKEIKKEKGIKQKEEIKVEEEKLIKVDTDLYTGFFSTRGGTVKSWILKKYKKRDNSELDLIKNNINGNLGIGFISLEGDTVNLSNRTFKPVGMKMNDTTSLVFDDSGKAELRLICNFDEEKYVEKIMKFSKDAYTFEMTVKFSNLNSVVADRTYWVIWGCGLTSSENSLKDEARYSKIYALMGDEVESLAPKGKDERKLITGKTGWIGVGIKYFTAVIIPDNFYGKEALLYGSVEKIGKDIIDEDFYGEFRTEFKEEKIQQDSYKIFIGPLEYPIISGFKIGLEKIMNFGWNIIRPIGKLIYYTLRFLYSFMGNYGIVIIVFSIIIKILFYPLTRSSSRAMRKMQEIQPQMTELREKYKKDPQKLNKAMMRLYKEKGVNPLGGCLPMLLQMPVFFAMYPLFYQMIEFRGAKFIWWIKDLSIPDTVAKLNLGMFQWNLNILPIIWAGSMFFQNKLTMKDPKQKMMVYLMPVIMLVFFNNLFSSGLVLYWTVFNILSIFGQFFIIWKKK